MSLDSDISWDVLRRIVQDWAGAAAELIEVAPLAGGCISTTLKLTTSDGQDAVLKISPHRVDRSYEEESHQLELLRSLGLPTPQVHLQKTGTLDDPFSYLLLEFLPGVDLAAARRQCDAVMFDELAEQLGEMVAALHLTTRDSYGRVTGNGEKGYASWPVFYHEVFDPVWHEAEKTGLLHVRQKKLIARVHERLEQLIGNDDQPRLVHWDIWASNVLSAPDEAGRWRVTAVLDPSCKFAHAEAELAYVDLFRTAGPAFTRAYQRTHKLGDTYHRVRKPVYQLYFLLNHLQLFGMEYQQRVAAAVERVASLV
jgi:fructosamine-3-kinase